MKPFRRLRRLGNQHDQTSSVVASTTSKRHDPGDSSALSWRGRGLSLPGQKGGMKKFRLPVLMIVLLIALAIQFGLTARLLPQLIQLSFSISYYEEVGLPYNFSISTADYQNPLIAKNGCGITVVLMDPSIEVASMWALESAAHFLDPREQVCIALHTSACQDPSLQSKIDRIYSEAKPHFRKLIGQGQVRISVLNHTLYSWESCSNFYSPNSAWLNRHYWTREFTSTDSDFLLTLQSDAVICGPFKFQNWLDADWVGAPWGGSVGDRFCSEIPEYWKTYHQHAAETRNNVNAAIPPYPYTGEDLCSRSRYDIGVHGNGGLSLRKRSWLLKAIEYCPANSALYSGLDEESFQKAICHAQEPEAEDLYFSTILRGLNASLPSVLDAALFSTETTNFEHIQAAYQLSDEVVKERMAVRGTTKPLGVHKPWPYGWFWPQSFCMTNYTVELDCPYFLKIMENSTDAQNALAGRGYPGCFHVP